MANWDDDDSGWQAPVAAVPAVAATTQWDGEDEDDGQGDSWDAQPAAGATSVKIVVPGERALTKQQAAKKKEAEEKEARLARETLAEKYKNDPEMAKLTKEQQKKAQEESDLGLAMDAFGGSGIKIVPREFKNEQLEKDNVDMAGGNLAAIQKELASLQTSNPLDNVPLKDVADYKAFGEKVTNMAAKAGNQKHLLAFLLAAIDKGTQRMKLEEVNEISRKMTAIVAAKQKSEKGPAKKGGAAASKKGQLSAGKGVAATGNASAFADEDYYDEDYAVC
jgi:hypothetical protein